MANMAVEMIGEMLLGVHNASTPSNDEWAVYLDLSRTMYARRDAGATGVCQMIITAGGAPNLDQRRSANLVGKGRPLPVAVLSESLIVRFAIRALVVANPNIRAFAPAQLARALAWLGVGGEVTVAARIAALQATVIPPTIARLPRRRTTRRSFFR